MRSFIILLLAASMCAAEPIYRTYLDYPTSLADVVTWMDRDLGDAGPQLIAAVDAQVAKPTSSVEFNEFVIYVARRFSYLAGRRGFVRGLVTQAATGKDLQWIDDDPKCILYAYASIKAGKPVLGVTFDAAKVFVYKAPVGPPIDPKTIITK
jgi:hypothetical protein